MSRAKTMSGARAQLAVGGTIVGIVNNVSYTLNIDVQAVNILGRFSPAELVATGQEPIQVTCTGFRVVDDGPYATMSVPQLQNLLNVETVTLSLFDRQSGPNKPIMVVTDCLSTGYNSGVAAKSLQEMTVNYLGLTLSDESGTQEETPGASTLP